MDVGYATPRMSLDVGWNGAVAKLKLEPLSRKHPMAVLLSWKSPSSSVKMNFGSVSVHCLKKRMTTRSALWVVMETQVMLVHKRCLQDGWVFRAVCRSCEGVRERGSGRRRETLECCCSEQLASP